MYIYSTSEKEKGDLCKWIMSGVAIHTYSHILSEFAWNHFILYMHINPGGLLIVCENGGPRHTP